MNNENNGDLLSSDGIKELVTQKVTNKLEFKDYSPSAPPLWLIEGNEWWYDLIQNEDIVKLVDQAVENKVEEILSWVDPNPTDLSERSEESESKAQKFRNNVLKKNKETPKNKAAYFQGN
ncbi:MAG: hypothetical protein IC227_08545 [Enterococcus lacertideformus]|uniref:Uncharacterized protein n=1 Tax=Enterococcus lacertideformus TaxID=2771493 RepID=A0A931FA45_9ENTE|nr:hypothetical protein [Enterococcus lacertideformus]